MTDIYVSSTIGMSGKAADRPWNLYTGPLSSSMARSRSDAARSCSGAALISLPAR